jgi:hypothetical protein
MAIVATILVFMMCRYSNWSPIIAPLITIIGWLFSFWMIFMVPMDLSLTTQHDGVYSQEMSDIWIISSYSNLALNYLVYPYVMAYIGSAGFTSCGRFKDALMRNFAWYVLYLIGGIAALMIVLFSDTAKDAIADQTW